MSGFNLYPTGYRMTFVNGWAVSVQWSDYHYCDNRNWGADVARLPSAAAKNPSCASAEVAVIMPNGDIFKDVIGWQSPDQVAKIIARVAKRKEK